MATTFAQLFDEFARSQLDLTFFDMPNVWKVYEPFRTPKYLAVFSLYAAKRLGRGRVVNGMCHVLGNCAQEEMLE